MLDILLLVARNRSLVLRVTVVFAILAVLLALLLPASYTAKTTLLPPQQNSSFSSMLLSQLGNLGSMASAGSLPGMKTSSDLHVGLMKSETVEDAVIHTYNLQSYYKDKHISDARKDLESHVTIDASGKDGLIRLAVRAKTPDFAATLANGYIDAYRRLSESLAIGEAAQRRLFLERQLQKTKDNLATAEEDLKRTEQTTGLIQLDSQARALIQSAASIRAQVAAKEVQIQSMHAYAGAGNADLMEAQQELAGMQAQLAKLGGSGDANGSDLMLPKGRIPQAGLEYARKLREVKYNETVFEIIARQYEAAKLDEAKEGSMVQVVDVAYPPDRRSGPPKILIIIGGILLGLFGAITWLISRQSIRHLRRLPEYSEKLNALSWKHTN